MRRLDKIRIETRRPAGLCAAGGGHGDCVGDVRYLVIGRGHDYGSPRTSVRPCDKHMSDVAEVCAR